MAWTTISESDLKEQLSGAELAAYRRAALADDQADPIAGILDGVVEEVRGRIAANRDNILADGVTIPASLIHHAIAIARYRLITRLPVTPSDARRAEYEDAMAVLRDIAAGKFSVEVPVTADDEKRQGASVQVVTERPRQATRSNMSGI